MIEPALYPYKLTLVKDNIAPSRYVLDKFGLDNKTCSNHGAGIKIAIIGSGTPKHKDISLDNISEISMHKSTDIIDHHGYSTMLSGMLIAHSSNIEGFVPLAEVLFIKAINDKAKMDSNTLSASILWATIKNADIILLPALPNYFNDGINNAIQKAYDMNICVMGFQPLKLDKIHLMYPRVLFLKPPFRKQISRRNISYSKNTLSIRISSKMLYTTFLEDTYTQPPSYIEGMATLAGLVALVSPALKKNGQRPKQETIVEYILSSSI